MQDLNDLHYFALVVEHGGYAAAERALGIPRSRLSRRIAQLEESLGVRLLQRSTRSFAVTEVGQNVYRHAQAMRDAAQAAQESVAQLSTTPRGLVRVSVPVTLAQEVMPEVLPAFLAQYPEVRLQLQVSNRRVDLIQESFDVALRVRSKLDDDGSLVMRSFGHDQQLLVASPDYLRKRGRPQQPEDLGEHVTLSMFEDDTRQQWVLHGPEGEVRTVELKPRLAAFDFQMLRALVKQGIGITMLPEMSCADAVKNGELEVILPQWKLPQGIIHAVFPSRRGMLPAVRAFIDHLAEVLPQQLAKKRCGPDCSGQDMAQ
ncbi:LysR family transcriptional regulator [Lysobacteraceae bacterium NML03-0222]|nr:LysR family transcriptional regulator [Xanthomonadaceae bacterium NML03-0222]PJK03974.1 LysR family transcriptional regulator [Xanthomonadaceae bacterium NML71-0210]